MFGSDAPPDAVDDLRGRSFASTVGAWRVVVDGRSRVLKHLALGAGDSPRWPSEPDERSPFWWRREVDFYREPPPSLPFRVPACDAFERGDGSVALWLEDVGDPVQWRANELAGVAARLDEMPAPGSLPGGFLPRYLELRAEYVPDGVAAWRHRDRILGLLDAAPRVLVHNDFHPGNVFDSGDPAVIDWAFCGAGAPGTDAGVLVADALFDERTSADPDDVIADVWEACADEAAELGYFAGTALRYAWAAGWNDHFAAVYAAIDRAARARFAWLV